MSSEPTDAVVIFKSICNFVKDLNFAFGDKLPSIQLYAHLLERTGLFHEEVLKRHIKVFEDFVTENEEAILQRSMGLLQGKHIIRYSEKVFIDLNAVTLLSEGDDVDTVWTHLLTIFAFLHPEKPAKEQLRRQKQAAAASAAAATAASASPTTISAAPTPAGGTDASVEDPMAMIGNIFQGLMGGLAGAGADVGMGTGDGTAAPNPFQALMQGMMSGAGAPSPDGTDGGVPPDPMNMLNSIMSSPMMSNLMQSIGGSDVDMTKVMDGMQKTISTLQTVLNDAGVPTTATPGAVATESTDTSAEQPGPTPELD